MTLSLAVIVTAGIFLWATVSARLERADLTAPIVFMAAGAALMGTGIVDAPDAPEWIKPLVEVTLVWVLFSDAARVRPHDFREDLGLYVRLLGVGLPLTVLAGWGLAAWLFPSSDPWLALLIAAALAPTDAALGVSVVTNPVVPSRVRRLIAVESGLNDGIATPIVMVAIAGAAAAEGVGEASGPAAALVQLAVGAGVGAAVGLCGGWSLRGARRRGWVAEDFAGVGVLALALLAYAAAVAVDGNGFVAAFAGGLAFGGAAGPRASAEMVFLEQAGSLVSLLVWLAFGAISVPVVLDNFEPSIVLYGVLSLTLVRMVPVALALLGARLGRETVLFVGWFGPRGLASLLFALLALEELGGQADRAVSVIAVTIFLSVVAHGLSAGPFAAWFGRVVPPTGPERDGSFAELPVRGLPRRNVPSDPRRPSGDAEVS